MLLLKVGTGVLPEGVFTVYALLDGNILKDLYVASSDGEALDKALEISGGVLECELALTAAARAHGLPVRTITPGEAGIRAHLAMSLFDPGLLKDVEPEVRGDFLSSAFIFADSATRGTRQWQFIAKIDGTIGDEILQEQVGVVMNMGLEPELLTMKETVLERLFKCQTKLEEVDMMGVRFETEPLVVAAALREPYGLSLIPRPFIKHDGRSEPVSPLLTEKLAALMGATGLYLSAFKAVTTWNLYLGGRVEIRLKPIGIAD